MSQTRSANPFRPGSGIFPPLLSGREPETAILEARIARTREGHPQHTALLGEWAIGKTTLLMHWRRRLEEAGDRVVLTMAYPQSRDDFLAALAGAAETDGGWTANVDLEVGVDVGVAEARLRKPVREIEKELRSALRRAARVGDRRTLVVMVDDVDLVATPGDALLQLRAICLELYSSDVTIAFVVSASPGLFGSIRGVHEPLVRFFEPITLGPLELAPAAEAITNPLTETDVTFDDDVVAEIVELSGGRPYYLQKLAYFAFDAAEAGRVGRAEFTAAFERAFASVSLEIFAARWSAMAPTERQVVSVVASASVARLSGEIEGEAGRLGIAPAATRQALRRLAARGHIDRLADGQRGRYAVRDRLFRRYLELQGLGW
ncbi:MAG TPA: ATP-binding protein [Candidatus Limnocylindrales bacterium]|nr:ATP-binding protein [Candidatus Limnocylindrales bacterium]